MDRLILKYFSQQRRLASSQKIMDNVVFTAFFVLSWILWDFLHFTPSRKTPATIASLYFSCCMPLIMNFSGVEMIILIAREMQMFFSCLKRTKYLNNEADDSIYLQRRRKNWGQKFTR